MSTPEQGNEADDVHEVYDGERPPLDDSSFVDVPGRIIEDAQGLTRTHEVSATITDEDGEDHELTADSHTFEPSGIAGRLVMKARSKVEGHEKAAAAGTLGVIVTVAAALAIRGRIKQHKRS